jgi:hypothetical protein
MSAQRPATTPPDVQAEAVTNSLRLDNRAVIASLKIAADPFGEAPPDSGRSALLSHKESRWTLLFGLDSLSPALPPSDLILPGISGSGVAYALIRRAGCPPG